MQGLDWDYVAKKKIRAPFKPHIDDELDVSNFSDEFTGQDVTYSPAVAPNAENTPFKVNTYNTLKNILIRCLTWLEYCLTFFYS